MSSSGTSNNRGQFAMTVMTCSGKTCDVHYTSARRESPPKCAGFFSIWYQRILTYPGKGSVFRLSAANVGCEEEFDKFMGFSKSLHELVESETMLLSMDNLQQHQSGRTPNLSLKLQPPPQSR